MLPALGSKTYFAVDDANSSCPCHLKAKVEWRWSSSALWDLPGAPARSMEDTLVRRAPQWKLLAEGSPQGPIAGCALLWSMGCLAQELQLLGSWPPPSMAAVLVKWFSATLYPDVAPKPL